MKDHGHVWRVDEDDDVYCRNCGLDYGTAIRLFCQYKEKEQDEQHSDFDRQPDA